MVESGADEAAITIEHVSDDFVGTAIAISSQIEYGMDFKVGPAASQFGEVIEFVGSLENDAAFYAFVGLEKDDGSVTTGWLKFKVGGGRSQPVHLGTGTGHDEWQVSTRPLSREADQWLLFRVNLKDAVDQTFGNDGWRFLHLEKFRIRGNLALDYISVFETRL